MGKNNRNNRQQSQPKPVVTKAEDTQVAAPELETIVDDVTTKTSDTGLTNVNNTPAQESEDQTTGDDGDVNDQNAEDQAEDEGDTSADAHDSDASEGADQEPVAEEVVEEETGPVRSSDPIVADLENKLDEYKDLLAAYGKNPKDFKAAAAKSASIMKLVVKNPKVPVLDALLKFFVDNKDSVAKPDVFMSGSTSLPHGDEQQVGVLFNLFYSLANKRTERVSVSFVTNILKKPEIISYYNRKVAGYMANR